MDTPQSRRLQQPERARPHSLRQRSNSLPIVEALGCSTPEAQLILAEGRAAVRKRRARSRRNRSVNDDAVTTFDPRDHMQYLHELSLIATPQERPIVPETHSCHARVLSNATDGSSCTVVPLSENRENGTCASPTSPLGDYSANLAQFIKAQLKSIPTYKPANDAAAPLSPQSCPDLSCPLPSPPQSPSKVARRPAEAPKIIDIPPVRPPMQSAFSAWSSTTDGDADDDALAQRGLAPYPTPTHSKGSSPAPSVLGYYEASNHSSFLLSSTPAEEEARLDTAKGPIFPDTSALPGYTVNAHHDDDDSSLSSARSRPQLISASAPSYTSSKSNSSYFDYKRPHGITASMRDRVVAAVTPPHLHVKMLAAMSPWEGGALANAHDLFIESQKRVHVDGMSFDMMGDRPTIC